MNGIRREMVEPASMAGARTFGFVARFGISWSRIRWTPGRRSAATLVGAFVGVASLVWVLTSPALLVHINWDAGAYLHDIASGSLTWSDKPWNVHFVLHYLYLLATWTVQPFGGTPADGFRLLDAVCSGLTFVLILHACLRLTRCWALAFLCAGLWLTAFVTMFLVFTLEDNLVYLTPAAVFLWLCATRHAVWSWREALAAGACAAAATLVSAQGVLYVAAAVYVTLVPRPRRVKAARRLGETALVIVGVLATTTLCVLALAATSRLTTRQLGDTLLAGPDPTEFPQTLAEIKRQATDLDGALRTLGLGVSYQLFRNRLPSADPDHVSTIGAMFVGGLTAVWVATAAIAYRWRRWAPHVFASTLLLVSLLTAPYRDVEYAFLKRTDFLPLWLAPLAASLLAVLRPGRWRRSAAAAVGAIVLYQASTALAWRSSEVRGYATLDGTIVGRAAPGYHGTPEGSFLRHFRAIRRRWPHACLYVFDASEVASGIWNHDVTGSLWSELRNHQVVGDPLELGAWRRAVRVLSPAVALATPECAWRSEATRLRLGPGAMPGALGATQPRRRRNPPRPGPRGRLPSGGRRVPDRRRRWSDSRPIGPGIAGCARAAGCTRRDRGVPRGCGASECRRR